MSSPKSVDRAELSELSVGGERAKHSRAFFRFDPFSTVFALTAIFLSSQVVASLIVGVSSGVFGQLDNIVGDQVDRSTAVQFAFIILTELAVVYMVLQLVKLARRKLSDIGLVRPTEMDVVRAVLGWVVYFVASFVIMAVVANYVSLDQNQDIGFDRASSQIDLLLIFLALAVFVPLAEEVMFRGFLFSSLRAKYGFYASTIVTSVIFGIAHLWNGSDSPLLWAVAVDTLVLSYIMCYLREKTGSLWPAIFIHMIKNGMAFVVLFGSRLI